MLKALIIKRLAVLAITAAATTVIPFVLQDRPKLLWVWDKVGPRIVDVAKDRVYTYKLGEPVLKQPIEWEGWEDAREE